MQTTLTTITRDEAQAALDSLKRDGEVGLARTKSEATDYLGHLASGGSRTGTWSLAIKQYAHSFLPRPAKEKLAAQEGRGAARRVLHRLEIQGGPQTDSEREWVSLYRRVVQASDSEILDDLRDLIDRHMRRHGDPEEGHPGPLTTIALQHLY